MTVVDIGANIGYYSLIAAEPIGTDGKVYAFEPDPDNYALLVRNVELNGYRNVETVEKAVSSESGFVTLYIDRSNFGNRSLGKNNILDDGRCGRSSYSQLGRILYGQSGGTSH
jgi:FkbM family methyltransferase